MLKQKTILEIVKGDKTYQLHCDPNANLGELHDVLSEWKAYVVKRITDAHEEEVKREKAAKDADSNVQEVEVTDL